MNGNSLDKISNLLTGRFGVPADEISGEATFNNLDLDSLTMIEMLLAVEEEFGVVIAEDEVSADNTVAAIVELIDSRKSTV
jgi:acyl carrier protein